MGASFRFGDIVLGPGDTRAGLIAELRRDDCRIQYLREGRSAWIELRCLRPAAGGGQAGPLDLLVRDLLRLLKANEMEFTMLDASRCRLDAFHGAILPAAVDQVRAALGDRLIAFTIRPQGMHRILSSLEFRA